ncbi:DUF4276 family protein [uncultured Imperialibacter sp.]|uniref:DUF4276 family protein n=1 Tax=uncultured Imperialibacter sp. TaxID=1672639 RepID=UPI0030DD6E8F|tara:strand:- start:460 stop:1131 length:672 start_codon:yes stop_codon:yes gene_type:complete
MKTIFIVVEGETEERFLRKVAYDHFIVNGIHIEAQQWLTNRKLGTQGGGGNFDKIENHIKRLASRYQANSDVFISTMIDLYAFPKQGNTIYDEEIKPISNAREKVLLLERKFSDRIAFRNFIPYIQLHEYESLIMSKPDSLLSFFTDKTKEIENLTIEVSKMSPEDINETPEGAPSKRIIKHIPLYKRQKTTAGVAATADIGLPFLRQRCPHFDDWITKLENV